MKRSISLLYYCFNFKVRFYPGNHVIREILTKHLKAEYTSYHHRQSLFKDIQLYSFYFLISIYFDFPISVMLKMSFWNGHNLWNPPYWTELKPRFCKTLEHYFLSSHLQIRLRRVTWLWRIKNRNAKNGKPQFWWW